MLHNKSLSANNPWENFQEIEWKINAAITNKEMADVIAKYREEMVSILKTNEAEETQDENTLNGLITKLKEKRALLEIDLWKTPPCKFDLSDNTAITYFWKSIIDGSNPDLKTWTAATPAEKKDVNDKITEALGKIQFVHDDSKWDVEKIFKLFKWWSTEITDIAKTTSDPLIQQLLNEKDPTKIDSTIDEFINSVKSTKWKTWWWNPFFISTTKLDEKGKDSERKVALRVVLYLYFIHRLANPVKWDKFKLTSALCTDINDKLDQLMNNEIPKIKWLHNTKVELWYLEPEYDTLKELNTKKWDIDQGTHNLWATALDLPINLTSEFETASPLTKDIDEYKVIENDAKITDAWGTVYKAYFLDWFWKTGDLFDQLASSTTPSVDLCIEVSWQKVKLWKLTLQNVSWNAQLKIDIDNEATIKAAFAAAWATMPSWNLDFEIPVKWIKNVSNWLTWCKAALIKNVKIALAPAGGPTPIPIPPVTVNDLEIDATISDMWTDVLKEKVAHDVEEELRKEYKWIAKWNVFKRAYFFLARWQMRNKRVKKKLADISWKAFTWDTAIDAHTQNAADRHELEKLNWLDADIKNIDETSAVVYQSAEINDLCKNYLQSWWTTPMSDADFQTKFNEILERDANLKDELNKANVTHMWTNILLKMKQKCARKDLIAQVSNNFEEYDRTKSNVYLDNINIAIENYIKQYQDSSKDLMTVYNDYLTDKSDATKIDALRNYLNHQKSVMALTTNNIKIKLDIIKWWKSAYQIDNKNREKSWKYKLWNWMDKHPLWTTVWTVWASIWLWALTWWLWLWAVAWAAISTAWFAGIIWTTNAVKKRTHHTKEQNTHEKDLVTDHANEMRKVQERIDTMNNWKWWKKYKAKRQLKLYNETTQSKIAITNIIADEITNMSSKIWVLSPDDENRLKYNLIEWRARLKYYREIWHNFLASNDKSKTEEDMNRLEKSIYLWISKMWATAPSDIESYSAQNNLSQTKSFNDIYDAIKDDFEKTDKVFRKERRKLSVKYWVWTALLSAWTAIGMQYLTGTWIFAKPTPGTPAYSSTNTLTDNFELWKHELLDTWVQNNIYNNTQSAVTSAPSWSTINIHYWAWTDATWFIHTPPTAADLATKVSTVNSNISSMTWLSATDKATFMAEVSSLWGWTWTNGVLQNMRQAEFLEQAARALSDSWQSWNVTVSLIHDTWLDVVWTHTHNIGERVVNWMIEVTKAEGPEQPAKTWWRWLMGAPTFFNTFKDREAA